MPRPHYDEAYLEDLTKRLTEGGSLHEDLAWEAAETIDYLSDMVETLRAYVLTLHKKLADQDAPTR